MNGDLAAAVQMLAADNARLCDIGVAADKLAEVVQRAILGPSPTGTIPQHWPEAKRMLQALEAYKIVRNGQ